MIIKSYQHQLIVRIVIVDNSSIDGSIVEVPQLLNDCCCSRFCGSCEGQ